MVHVKHIGIHDQRIMNYKPDAVNDKLITGILVHCTSQFILSVPNKLSLPISIPYYHNPILRVFIHQ